MEPPADPLPAGWHDLGPGLRRRPLRPGSAVPRSTPAQRERPPTPVDSSPHNIAFNRFVTSSSLSFPNPRQVPKGNSYRANPIAAFDLYPKYQPPAPGVNEVGAGLRWRENGNKAVPAAWEPRADVPATPDATVQILSLEDFRGQMAADPHRPPPRPRPFTSDSGASIESNRARALVSELRPWLVRKDPTLAAALARLQGRVSALDHPPLGTS